jgi:L-alanine-DL-glutamate epimerase-like enolase superfamily enzyme
LSRADGGAIETERIADYAFKNNIETAVHMAGGPVNSMATVHMCATFEQFHAMENTPWICPGGRTWSTDRRSRS